MSRKKTKQPKKIKQLAALNGTCRIHFAPQDADIGFAVLTQGGRFHGLPEENYIVSAHHRQLLDAVSVPYEVVETPYKTYAHLLTLQQMQTF